LAGGFSEKQTITKGLAVLCSVAGHADGARQLDESRWPTMTADRRAMMNRSMAP
jgi:hypothetical protein